MEVTVTLRSGQRGVRNLKYRYEETYFEARRYPEAVFLGEDVVTGPFCKNCGYAERFHGKDHRRPRDTCPPPCPIQSVRNPMDPRPDAVRI